MVSVRPSDGARLTRNDKIELDPEVVQAAKESLSSGTAQVATFATEREAKATLAKLRTRINSDGQGLRATVYEENGEWQLEFRVSATKRSMPERTQ